MEKSKIFFFLFIVFTLPIIIAARPIPDKAKIESARAFFKDKSIEFVVPYAPGGGYDGKARLMQRFLEKYLPRVKVLVKNMPGGGSMVATNQVYVARPNGLTIAILSGVGIVANQIAETPVVKYDATKFTYLGRIDTEKRVLIAGLNSKVKDLDTLLKPTGKVRQALTGPGSGSSAVTQIVLSSLGFPREDILGYQSSKEAQMAVIRGETDIHLSGTEGAELARRKEVRPIVLLTASPIEGLEKVPNLFSKELMEKLKLSDDTIKRISFARDLMSIGYILAAPPKLPPERSWLLEEAIQKTLHDREFVELGRKSGIIPLVEPLSGEEVLLTVKRLLSVSPEIKSDIKKLMKPL